MRNLKSTRENTFSEKKINFSEILGENTIKLDIFENLPKFDKFSDKSEKWNILGAL